MTDIEHMIVNLVACPLGLGLILAGTFSVVPRHALTALGFAVLAVAIAVGVAA